MKKIVDGFWEHRKHIIYAKHGGYVVDGCSSIMLNVYKTLKDAVAAVNQSMDGTNKTEPRIIGELFCDDSGDMKMNKVDRK